MKKIIIYLILVIGTMACKDQEFEFYDFDYTAVYFPIQLPLRTLSLGEDRIDNTLDKSLQFDIAVSIGGLYAANNNDWSVDFEIDNSLTDSAYIIVDDETIKIQPLPTEYYTLEHSSMITIPRGSFNGTVRVQLTNAFFDDPIALSGAYVMPLRITNTSADSILVGAPANADIQNPDKRDLNDWEAGKSPKDWVLYGIKYVNGYHGSYLQRGQTIVYSGDTPIDTVTYRDIHVERDNIVFLTTSGKNTAVTNFISQNTSTTGGYAMNLEFPNMWGTPGGDIVITPSEGSSFAVTGSGQFMDKNTSTESIIGIDMQSMHLNYTYEADGNTYVASDTLVFRDRDLKFEENSIIISEN
ncbi:DUF1735 domain-containing protein [Cyclobacterium sp. 1_MG-2023]|uniref:BT_3987 domain-containing protein n=1 Tax=Cyclobacterium sp. 1_MG-2023 TaxID=3062681 RepID=UPI0026E157CA|nr:DUF1735 domain-containing protein [Cyclobacterium sp. 1_MG-2023]MDO6439572.1 DUF1735 domain-containing protein [Cyclobacterium sp. 1_MG-2023]